MKQARPLTSRLFIAIPIHHRTRGILNNWTQNLSEQLSFHKWVHPADYHITLKYLGEVTFSTTQRVKKQLQQTTAEMNPFTLSIAGLGTFGAADSPRVLYTNIEGDVAVLQQLQQDVEEQLVALDFPAEKRSYTPHLTLARKYKGNQAFQPGWLQELPQPKEGDVTFEVKEIVLFQTHPQRRPMYQPVAIYPFG